VHLAIWNYRSENFQKRVGTLPWAVAVWGTSGRCKNNLWPREAQTYLLLFLLLGHPLNLKFDRFWLGCIKCMRCRLLLLMFTVFVCLSVSPSRVGVIWCSLCLVTLASCSSTPEVRLLCLGMPKLECGLGLKNVKICFRVKDQSLGCHQNRVICSVFLVVYLSVKLLQFLASGFRILCGDTVK